MMIPAPHNNYRLAGSAAFADLGTGNSRIQLYATAQPALGAAGGTPLVEITLAKPCGAVVANVLVLAALVPGGVLIETTGTVLWARWLNGNGDLVADGTVTDSSPGATGDFRIAGTDGTTIYAGAYALLGVTALG